MSCVEIFSMGLWRTRAFATAPALARFGGSLPFQVRTGPRMAQPSRGGGRVCGFIHQPEPSGSSGERSAPEGFVAALTCGGVKMQPSH